MKICKVKGCKNKHHAKNYCSRHYDHMKFYGKILKRTKFDPNEFIDCGNYYEIVTYNKKNKNNNKLLIDKDDYKKCKKYKWCSSEGYGLNNKNKLKLHHLILGKPPKGFEIDHINGLRYDNRKQNLRIVTHSQNLMNNKALGVHYNKKNKWESYIMINYKLIHLGRFKNKQDAIKARKQAEIKYFGEYRYKN